MPIVQKKNASNGVNCEDALNASAYDWEWDDDNNHFRCNSLPRFACGMYAGEFTLWLLDRDGFTLEGVFCANFNENHCWTNRNLASVVDLLIYTDDLNRSETKTDETIALPTLR